MRRPVLIVLLLLAAAFGAAMLHLIRQDRGQEAARSAPTAGPSAEMMVAMDRMHERTGKVPMTGDLDRDFVALMVPHHESAVEMARVYLEHGRDPELRRLSGNIIASQETEIRQMRGRAPAPAAGAGGAHAGH